VSIYIHYITKQGWLFALSPEGLLYWNYYKISPVWVKK